MEKAGVTAKSDQPFMGVDNDVFPTEESVKELDKLTEEARERNQKERRIRPSVVTQNRPLKVTSKPAIKRR